jgi:hypothetical protein
LLLVAPAAVTALYRQLDAKQRLHRGETADAIAAALAVPAEKLAAWAEDLAAAGSAISARAATPGLKPADLELAADYLLPLALVAALSGRSAT